MDLGLRGKTAVVIGGSSNLGRSCCIAFAKEGANVVVAARHLDDCEKVAGVCRSLDPSGDVVSMAVDARKVDQCLEFVQRTRSRFERIDILVISMGWNRLAYFLELEPSDWETIIATNYWSNLAVLRAVLPVMIEQKKGSIVTISSVIGRKGDAHESVYGGCKAAQINLTHSLALDMAKHNVRLNIVAPALTAPESQDAIGTDSLWSPSVKGALTPEAGQQLFTQFVTNTPMNTLATPTDVANAVLFFASDVMSGHVTGNVIGTDGGMYMSH